jgi:hypothetical protein
VEGGNKMRRQWTSQERNQGVGIKIRIDGHSGLTVRTSGRYKSSEGYQAAALLSGTAPSYFYGGWLFPRNRIRSLRRCHTGVKRRRQGIP